MCTLFAKDNLLYLFICLFMFEKYPESLKKIVINKI